MSRKKDKKIEGVRLIAFDLGRTLTDDECKAVSGGGWTRTDKSGGWDWGDVEP